MLLKQKSQQYISQFTEDPILAQESFVLIAPFNSYRHEAHDIAQKILSHFSVHLESFSNAPRRSGHLMSIPYHLIYLLQRFKCIKISFDDFEQFAIDMEYLMNFQADVLSMIKKTNKKEKGKPNFTFITQIPMTNILFSYLE
ncbi:28838_t:CDS:2 [Dentiscutata erythropus]|uniref:28838_t:CDS:1 n=1 Tax=Dentiscutata erythropus TaxID=1348616 RepID=A0A9N9NGY1_9GLOM|nr:28838_t:CDS:2 [Dentiscutata erythropus]